MFTSDRGSVLPNVASAVFQSAISIASVILSEVEGSALLDVHVEKRSFDFAQDDSYSQETFTKFFFKTQLIKTLPI